MTVTTEQYARKPFYVDAVQVTEDNIFHIAQWCKGEVIPAQGEEGCHIKVKVHHAQNERQTRAYIGDWVLYANRGYKVYSKAAFAKNFEPKKGTALSPEQQEQLSHVRVLESNANGAPVTAETAG